MNVKVGCDLVRIRRFKESMERGGEEFLNKVFTRAELASTSKPESLAGIFAAKEAVIKALGGALKLKAGDWKKIEIIKKTNGRPEVKLLEFNRKILSRDISISHDGEYAMAVTIILINS